jgi:acetyl esterase
MADRLNLAAGDDVEAGIRLFQQRCSADYERLAFAAATDIREKRRIAEAVRAPWATGGPAMAQSTDRTAGDMEVAVRIHQPVADPGLPVLIYVHGGGWMLFSVESHDRLMREYAARARVTVIGVDYSLAPEARFPVPLEEILSVVRWLRGDARGDGIIPSKVAIGGDSAGANLAIATNLALKQAGQPVLDAQLLNYGAFDPDRRPSWGRFGGPAYGLTAEEMDEFWANYLPPESSRDPLARPLLADLGGLPPTYLCIAECDILADENKEMAKELKAAGVAASVQLYEGATHSFLEAVSVSPLADRALAQASDWLAEVLKP